MNTDTTTAAISCWSTASLVLPHARVALLWGPAGTGKSYAAQRLGLKPEQQAITVTLTDDTSAADLLGYYINTPSGYKWQDGPATYAWRTGARLVLNEIDHANGDATAALYAILDDVESASMRLANGEVITPHPDFTCVATSNATPDDALRGEGLRSRFCLSLNIEHAHPQAVLKLPLSLRNAALGLINHPDPEQRISMRHFRMFTELVNKLGEKQAPTIAEAVFGKGRGQPFIDSVKMAAINT